MKTLIFFNLRRRFLNRMTLLINLILLLVILFVFHADYFLTGEETPRHYFIDDSTAEFQSSFLAEERGYEIYNGVIGEKDILIRYDGQFTIISNVPVSDDLLEGLRQDIQQALKETYCRKYPKLKPYADAFSNIGFSVRITAKPEDRLWIVASALYFLLMNYSGTIASEVVYEKTNHLLESLLTA